MAKKSKKPLISPETYHEDDRYMDACIEAVDNANNPNFSSCTLCKHQHKDRVTCKAFPAAVGGIPIDILSGGTSHMEPYPGDNGIQFEINPNGKEKEKTCN